jgi:hypothetical protein
METPFSLRSEASPKTKAPCDPDRKSNLFSLL